MYIGPHGVPFEKNEYELSKFEIFAKVDTRFLTLLFQGFFNRERVEIER